MENIWETSVFMWHIDEGQDETGRLGGRDWERMEIKEKNQG